MSDQVVVSPKISAQRWAELTAAAEAVSVNARCSYSGYPVGVAVCDERGRVFTGVNVESAVYLAIHAEWAALAAAAAAGATRLVALVCAAGPTRTLKAPCGICRQLLWEMGGPELEILTADGVLSLAELLPGAFDASNLDASNCAGDRS